MSHTFNERRAMRARAATRQHAINVAQNIAIYFVLTLLASACFTAIITFAIIAASALS